MYSADAQSLSRLLRIRFWLPYVNSALLLECQFCIAGQLVLSGLGGMSGAVPPDSLAAPSKCRSSSEVSDFLR